MDLRDHLQNTAPGDGAVEEKSNSVSFLLDVKETIVIFRGVSTWAAPPNLHFNALILSVWLACHS